MVISFLTNIFQYEKFPIEYECWKQLKNEKNINYIAIPWAQIQNSTWLNFPGKCSVDYYRNFLIGQKIEQKNNFTICQHDDYYKIVDHFYHFNIVKIFCPLLDKNTVLNGIEIIPLSGINIFNFKKIDKDILFSFVGTYTTHKIREYMRDFIVGKNLIYRSSFHVDSNFFESNKKVGKTQDEVEYQQIQERSRYTLCPRGSNPSSFRFWESLAAGSIPILISDNWVLPEWDWDNTIIRISEEEFLHYNYHSIEHLIRSYEHNEEKMRENCYKAYDQFKKENYKEYILKRVL